MCFFLSQFHLFHGFKFLSKPRSVLVIGGHNLLVLAHDLGQYTQLGTSVDDAIGEAFDKTAKWLGLDMRRSGGPAVEELAREGDAKSVKFNVSHGLKDSILARRLYFSRILIFSILLDISQCLAMTPW